MNIGLAIKIILPLAQRANISYNHYFPRGNLNDGKAAIPLLKGIDDRLSLTDLKYQTMDAGYDYEAIYQQVYRIRSTVCSSATRRLLPAD